MPRSRHATACGRGHPSLRHEHVAAAAAVRRGGAGRAISSPPLNEYPDFVVRRADGGGGGIHRGRAGGGDRRRWRGRDPGSGRQGLSARGPLGAGAHPDLRHVRRPHQAARRRDRGCALAGDKGYALDVDAVVGRLDDVALVWLCSPNNPTGTVENSDDIEAVLDAAIAERQPPLCRRRGLLRVQRPNGGRRGGRAIRTSSWCAPCQRPLRWPASGWVMGWRIGR